MSEKASIRASLVRIVAEAFPSILFGYPRTYVVQSVGSDLRLDLSPPSDHPELPELKSVEQWSLGGALVTPTPGTQVVVVFLDADPARPVVVGFGLGTPLKSEVGATVELKLAGGILGVARMGDPVQAGPFTGAITLGSLKVKAG